MADYPFITIVVPVRNEARFIGPTLEQLLSQDYPPDRYEVLVVDGMSDDDTRRIVTAFAGDHPQIRLLDNPKRLSSAGRNVGFVNGRGDVFVVVDGHCHIPTSRFLLNTCDCLARSGADCLGRPQPLDPPDLSDFQKAVALARGSRLGHGGESLIYGDHEGFASPVSNGASYRKEVFGRIGYVDESFDACEDLEFNYRVEQAGLTSYTSPALTVRYYPRENLTALWRQMVRYGKGRFRFVAKHPRALTFNQLVPVVFVLGLVLAAASLVFALVARSWAWTLPLVPYLLYVLAVLVESTRFASRNGWRHLLRFPAILFTIHAALGAGFLLEGLRPARRARRR